MNKQQLTKTFSFSKWILFFFFAVGLTLSSCGEDYDDDISKLQKQLDGMSDYQAVKDKITGMESALATAKKAAEDAQAEATKALAATENLDEIIKIAEKAASDAQAAAGKGEAADAAAKAAQEAADAAKADAATAKTKAQEAIDAAAKALTDANAHTNAEIAKLDAKFTEEIKKLANGELPATEVEKIVKQVIEEMADDFANVEQMVSDLVGHRLTSIAFIPHANINGIPAMKFYSLSYIPQSFVAHDKLEHTTVDAGKAVSLSSQEMVIQYRMNPRIGVRSEDMLLPSYDCIVSTNDMTKSVPQNVGWMGHNTPIKPIAAGVVKADGVYEVKVVKVVADDINREWLDPAKEIEKFYMASLNVPIANSALTAAEIANIAEKGESVRPSVHSEYVRIADQVVTPFLKQKGSVSVDSSDDVHLPGTPPNIFPHLNEVDATGKWIHYHDSTSLYQSADNVLIDHVVHWKNGIDLKTLVDVCIIQENHKSLEDYKSYGLAFRFYLPSTPYKQGGNQTDQQRFARIDSPQNGFLTSKVYDYDGDGGDPTQTAIGREPIVRAMLVDTVNNKLVAQRYIKLQFGTTGSDLDPYKFPDHYVSCDTVSLRFGTQEMNERVYRAVELAYGWDKTTFHSLYDGVAIDTLRQDGKIITTSNHTVAGSNYVPNVYKHLSTATLQSAKTPTIPNEQYSLTTLTDPNSNESWNLVWVMQPVVVGKVGTTAAPRKSTYELSFRFTSSAGQQSIKMKFLVDIIIPDQVFNYFQSAWRNGGSPEKSTKPVFNVNPFVFSTPLDGSAGTIASPVPMKDFSHIEADMVNGWLYKKGTGEWADGTNKKPANLAQFIRMIRHCADVRFEFDPTRKAQYTGQKDTDGITKANLSSYTISPDNVELWRGPVGTSTMSTGTHLVDWFEKNVTPDYAAGQQLAAKDTYAYIQDPTMAASISNLFGATALENQKNLAWNYNETLGLYPNYLNGGTEGVASSIIRLHEIDKENGTTPAIDLIDKKLPVRLVVEYNPYNVITEEEFEVFFVNPLTVTSNISGNFEDAVVDGDYLDANKGLAFTDWNNYLVSKTDNPSVAPLPTEKQRYPWDLWNYYAVNDVIYDVDNVKTSLRWDGATYIHDITIKNGDLPSVASLKQAVLVWNPVTEEFDKLNPTFVSSNPTHLGYFNNSGTPVNTNFMLYIPLKVTYKWGIIKGEPVPVEVVKAGGTPSINP